MTFLRNITLTIVILSVINVVLSLLVTDKYRKQMQVILSIISAISIAGLLLNADFSDISTITWDLNFEDYGTSYTDKAVIDELNERLAEHIHSVIKENGIDVKNVSVKTNIDDERCIFISKISLTITNEGDKEAVNRIIERNVGSTEVEITVSEDVNGAGIY